MPESIWTASQGIAANTQLSAFLDGYPIRRIRPWRRAASDDLVVGWGNKANTARALQFAQNGALEYCRLEDGFIGYAGHPSHDKQRLSLIVDRLGMYYDATHPSDLEVLCQQSELLSDNDYLQRAETLIRRMTAAGVSKYNHVRVPVPEWLLHDSQSCGVVLVIDQTFGDMSVGGGLADAGSFAQMLASALADYPDHRIVIKTHPDVLHGKKKGYFSAADLQNPRVALLTDDCNIADLMAAVAAVYCVTSQLGFEALLYGKQVYCFGIPFYAGWGLTIDVLRCNRRTARLSLPQLVVAALLLYPRYVHPEEGCRCDAEAVLDWLLLQLQPRGIEPVDVCYAWGFSLWKRAFIPVFIGRMAARVEFVSNESALLKKLAAAPAERRALLLWGAGHQELLQRLPVRADGSEPEIWRIEDGFVRSVGLGADLRRPSCLVVDKGGLYYQPDEKSDLIGLLNHSQLTAEQLSRGLALQQLLRDLAVTKYNVGEVRPGHQDAILDAYRQQAQGRPLLLVPGQFEQDLSIACSRGAIKSNYGLLEQVRHDFPDAYIIYKEHPDLYSGVRPGALGKVKALTLADAYVSDIDMHCLIEGCDRVCTMTSLSGFEALVRGKSVTVYGSPFYAGWGLTDDRLEFPQRTARLTTAGLLYVCLVEYCRCVNWDTRMLTSPEYVIQQLASERAALSGSERALRSSWLARQLRKTKYLFDALLG